MYLVLYFHRRLFYRFKNSTNRKAAGFAFAQHIYPPFHDVLLSSV